MTRRRWVSAPAAAPVLVAGLVAVLVAVLGACLAGCSGSGADVSATRSGAATSTSSAPGRNGTNGTRSTRSTTGTTSTTGTNSTNSTNSTNATTNADPQAAREDALTHLLARRADAVLHHDRAAFLATLDDSHSAFGRRQQAAYDALILLPLSGFGYGTVQVALPLSTDRVQVVGPNAWVVRIQGRYRLAGYDRADRTYDIYLTVVHRPRGWRLADDVDGGSQPQPWDLPGLHLMASPHAIVMGNVPDSMLRTYLTVAERAVGAVDVYWRRSWPKRLVVVAPDTVARMQAQLSAAQGDVSQVAAVTDGPTPDSAVTGSDRVVVNPAAFRALTPEGRTVVLTHEATHVAVRASLVGRVPLWLSEGTADLVGYSVVNRPDTTVAAALVAAVKRSGPPTALPVDGQFDSVATTIGPSYNEAWLAARLIDRRLGHAGLTAFYVAAASTGSDADVDMATDGAFTAVLHTSRTAFTRDWLAAVRALVPAS